MPSLLRGWRAPGASLRPRGLGEGKRRRGRSLQAEARWARYRFLEEVASHVGATKIALGHHRDDQAETVLLHLLRGSSLRGLRGMLALREGRLTRPLLEVGREDIEGYVKAHQLSFVEDPSNQNIRHLRNRIRWKLLPLLQREYNPAMARTLARMAAFVAEDEGYLEERAGETFNDLAEVQGTRICMSPLLDSRLGLPDSAPHPRAGDSKRHA